MYETYYDLRTRPFQLTPDPDFYFESLTHRKALSYLGYGLAQGEGFIVISGEVGSGKTTLVRHLMSTIDKARLTAANIVTTAVDGGEMVALALHDFGVDADERDHGALLARFESFLHDEARAGRRCLLIVDEAQNLSNGALEELRMLSNFQLGGHALLQIFLLGQPEFRERFQNASELEQLRQRVIAHHNLGAMEEGEVEAYIAHRLDKAGWTGRPTFTGDIFARIHTETRGIPRLVNQLMSRVLLMGAVEGIDRIDNALLERVVADLAADAEKGGGPARRADADQPDGEQPVLRWPGKRTDNADAPTPIRASAPSADRSDGDDRAVADLRAEIGAAREAVQSVLAAVRKAEQPDAALLARIDDIAVRLARLEQRSDAMEAHLQRILIMMVDWVERDIGARTDHVGTGRAA